MRVGASSLAVSLGLHHQGKLLAPPCSLLLPLSLTHLFSPRPSFFHTCTHPHPTQDWENSYYACGGIVYLIDLSDKDRFAESKLVLDGLLATEHLQQTPIVILGNKCDIMGCAREDEVRAYFNMQVRAAILWRGGWVVFLPLLPPLHILQSSFSLFFLSSSFLFLHTTHNLHPPRSPAWQPTGKKTVPIAKDSGIRPLEFFMCSIKNGYGFGDSLNWLTYYVESKPNE